MRNFKYLIKSFYLILLVFLLVACGSSEDEESTTTATSSSEGTIAVSGTINSSQSGSGDIIIKLVDDFKNFNTAASVGATTLSVNGDFSFNVSKNAGNKHLLIFVDANNDQLISDNEYYGAFEITITDRNYIITNALNTSHQYLIPDLSEVTGSWASECQQGEESDDFNFVQSVTFSINGNFKQLNDYYESSDTSCAFSVVLVEEINSTYSLGDPLPLLSNTNKINFVVTGWTWTPKDTTWAGYLNDSAVCGFTDWANGQMKSIAGMDCNNYQPLAVGGTLYDIFELQSSTLMYSGITSGTSEATRPTSVNTSVPYTKAIDGTLPAAPSSFTATAGDGQVTLGWTNPNDLDFIGVEIRRSTIGTPTSETDGDSIYTGSGTSTIDTSVTNGTLHYYSIFAKDASNNYSTAATNSATPIGAVVDSTPPSAPTSFTATAGDGQVVLTWTNPGDADFEAVEIRRAEGSAPAAVTDGTSVYTGDLTSVTDTGLTNGTIYYYSIFASDEVPNWSSSATASATPTAPVAGIDLVVSVDNVAYDGTDVTITYTITNNGSQSTDGTLFYVRFWENSSTQPSLSDENYRINTFWSNGDATKNSLIGAGVSRTASQTFSASTVPVTVTSGIAWVSIDYTDVIAESNETNNVSSGVAWGSVDSTAPATPTGFTATAGDGEVVLNWTNPSDDDFAGVEVRRATGSAPNTELDGTSVYVGTLTTYTDGDVSNDTTYYYSIFAKDEVPNWSSGVNDSAIPTGSIATNLTLGSYVDSEIISGQTEQIFSFEAQSGKTYRVNFQDKNAQSGSVYDLDIKVAAYKADFLTAGFPTRYYYSISADSAANNLFVSVDDGYNSDRYIHPDANEKVYFVVEPYSSGNTGTFSIKVTEVTAATLSLNPTSLSVDEDSTGTITATATTDGTTADTISTVVSSDTDVATVTFSGNIITVSGVSDGSATVTITSGSDETATCAVTINTPSGAAATLSYSNDIPQDIPDDDISTGVSSTITVSGGATSISKVTVTLNITHTWTGDLHIYLQAPGAADGIENWIELSTENGSFGENFTNTVFDDDAATDITAITSGDAPFTGSYSPEGSLTTLDGSDANGNWILHVFDDSGSDTGSLDNWTLTITGTGASSVSSTAFDFEDGSIPGTFAMSGNADWVIDNTETANGSNYSLKAGSISHSQTSCVSFTSSAATDYISFYDKISTEDSNDTIKFYIDGTAWHVHSGDEDWTKRAYGAVHGISNQIHEFKWCYEKNDSISSNSDTIWIDDISLVSP